MSTVRSVHGVPDDCPPFEVRLLKQKRLGEGALGYVYKAETSEGGAVAIKKSRCSLRVKRTNLAHEGTVLQLLALCPRVVDALGYGRVEHFEYLAVTLEGPSLSDIADERRLSGYTCTVIALQILEALSFIHGKGLIHRDVKPGNIVTALDGSLNVKLIDFGLACQASATEPAGAGEQHYWGTLEYCSHRAHLGPGLSFRDDLESLSYTILRLVRGNLPWAVTSFQSRWDENIHFAVQDLKAKLSDAWLFEGLPSELADLRALARELQLGQAPDLQESIRNLTSLAASLLLEDYPWQPIEPVPYPTFLYNEEYEPPESEPDAQDDAESGPPSYGSYRGYDIDMWDDRQHERSALLTTSWMGTTAAEAPALRQITSIIEVWPVYAEEAT